jgi:hypothetical protein
VGFLDLFRKPKRLMTPAEIDRLSLRHLEIAGANLALPRHVIHYLYFEREGDARRAGDEIPEAGWEATVIPPTAESARWAVRAEATRVVDQHTIEPYRAWFEQIADACGGEYDGWEAATKP